MLPKLTGEIAECYRHATDARERAKTAPNRASKHDFLDMERRWLSLAHGYEFAEQLSNVTDEAKQRLRKKVAPRAGRLPGFRTDSIRLGGDNADCSLPRGAPR